MNIKRLLLAILAVFATIFLTDFLIHGVWMMPVYRATASLWRPEAEMGSHMGWMFASYLLISTTFVLIWAKGFASQGCSRCAVMYGLCMALFTQAQTLIMYAVAPFTLEIVWKWFVAGVLQGILLGLVTSFVYKPAAAPAARA